MGIPAAQGVDGSGLPPAGDQANAVVSGTFKAIGPGLPFAFRGPMNLLLWASITTALTTTTGSTAATVTSATGLAVGDAVSSVNAPPGTTIGVLAGTNATLALPTLTLPGVVSTSSAQMTGLPSTTGLLGATVSGPGYPAGVTVLGIVVPAIAATNISPGQPGTLLLSSAPTIAPVNNAPQLFAFALTGNGITTTGADAAASFTGATITFNGTIQMERSFDGGQTWIVGNIGGAGFLAQWTGAAVGPVSLTFGEPEKNVLYRLNCTAFTSVLGGGTINYRISQTGGAAESLAIGPLSGG